MSVISELLHFIGQRRLYRGLVCIFIVLLTKQLLYLYRLDRYQSQEPNDYNINISQPGDVWNLRLTEMDNYAFEINKQYNSMKTTGEKHNSNSLTGNGSFIKTDGVNAALVKHRMERAHVSFSNINKFNNNIFESNNINSHFHIHNNSEKDPLLNLHKFVFSINSQCCTRYNPDIVIFVHSATVNEDRRSVIRDSWGRYSRVMNVTLSTVFMVGQADHESIQENLQIEAELYGDIVQGNFKDTYKNLTYKHIMGFHWILSNCPTAKLFVKTDDDVLVNVFNVIDYLSKTGFWSNLLYCNFQNGGPMRQVRNKWYVTPDVYPFNNYPPYCEGMGYLISPDVARILYEASSNTRFYWIDDVYVTGILTLKVGQKLTPMIDGYMSARMRSYHRVNVQNHMFLVGTQLYSVLWKALLINTPDKLKENTKYWTVT